MCDVRPGQPVNARVLGKMALGDLREQAIVAMGEVITNLAELLIHDVEVVEQPLFGRRDLALRAHSLDDVPVCTHQHAAVVTYTGE